MFKQVIEVNCNIKILSNFEKIDIIKHFIGVIHDAHRNDAETLSARWKHGNEDVEGVSSLQSHSLCRAIKLNAEETT